MSNYWKACQSNVFTLILLFEDSPTLQNISQAHFFSHSKGYLVPSFSFFDSQTRFPLYFSLQQHAIFLAQFSLRIILRFPKDLL